MRANNVDSVVLPCGLVIIYVQDEHPMPAQILVPTLFLAILEEEILIAFAIVPENVGNWLGCQGRHVLYYHGIVELYGFKPSTEKTLVAGEAAWFCLVNNPVGFLVQIYENLSYQQRNTEEILFRTDGVCAKWLAVNV